MKKVLSLVLFVLLLSSVSAQDYDIGIRAGLNYSKFSGPSESGVNESYSISNGFHFGINFQWNFNSVFGIKSEILYSQIGSGYTYDDEGYYIFDFLNTTDIERFVVRDHSKQTLDISNAHVSFPLTGHIKISEKLEIFGGGYFGILLSPIGIGEWTFGNPGQNASDHTFRQTLDYQYNSDFAGRIGFNSRSQLGNPNSSVILIIVNQQDVNLARLPGAYFLLLENPDANPVDAETLRPAIKRFSGIDFGVIGGLSYYINRGLYASVRLEYGLSDITNTEADFSLKNVNDDGTLIFNDDFDRNVNIALSIGFKF